MSSVALRGQARRVLLPQASAHNSCLLLLLIGYPSEVVLPRHGPRPVARVVPIPTGLEIRVFGTTRFLPGEVKHARFRAEETSGVATPSRRALPITEIMPCL